MKKDPSALVMLLSKHFLDHDRRRIQYHMDILTARQLQQRCTVIVPSIQQYQLESGACSLSPALMLRGAIDAVFMDGEDDTVYSHPRDTKFKYFTSFKGLDKWIEGRLEG